MVARDRINEWAGLPYYNPTEALREGRRRGFSHKLGGRSAHPPDITHHQWKVTTQGLDAALFAHGLRQLFPPERDVCLSPSEAQDHDFVLRFSPADEPIYCPVQLKVLVSKDVSPELTPESLLDGLSKYSDASDLVVAVKIDRPGVDPRRLKVPALRVGELWFFGPRSGAADGWYIYGDCLSTPQWFEFETPVLTTTSGAAGDLEGNP